MYMHEGAQRARDPCTPRREFMSKCGTYARMYMHEPDVHWACISVAHAYVRSRNRAANSAVVADDALASTWMIDRRFDRREERERERGTLWTAYALCVLIKTIKPRRSLQSSSKPGINRCIFAQSRTSQTRHKKNLIYSFLNAYRSL